jgi:hypothetical protein
MGCCEKCWRDAALRVLLLGGTQAERYQELLNEREGNPCTPEEQWGTFWQQELPMEQKG